MWTEGRQGTGYFKIKIFSFFRVDCYILKFPKSSKIPSHLDICPGYAHHRINIVLKRPVRGGELSLDGKSITGRVIYFRPDKEVHEVSEILSGTRYVLSFGWLKSLRG